MGQEWALLGARDTLYFWFLSLSWGLASLERELTHGWPVNQTCIPCLIGIQTVPDLPRFNWRCFDFTMVQKRYAFSRNRTSKYECGSFSGLAIAGTSSLVMLGSGSEHSSHQPHGHGWAADTPATICTQTIVLSFTFCTVFNKLHEIHFIIK